MVLISGGTSWCGADEDIFPDARPMHQVRLDSFWIDVTPVTNKQFARFVEATGYKTVAERAPNPADFPGEPAEMLVPGSIVFSPPDHQVSLDEHLQWWNYIAGANWRHPEGPQSDLSGRGDHPVVHVCWDDAMAYARWAGKRLPTEAEFEYAARGGLDRQPFAWGDEMRPDGKWQANTWQGVFPVENTAEDGYPRTSPVKSFPANGYGLFDMAGNVWQWCSDWYRPDYYTQLAATGEVVKNPLGPSSSFDPLEPGLAKRVQRGGSFLCSSEYCVRYRVAGRGKGEVTSASSNVGFRCAKSP
jgi:formylglycine-generating enzyme required for sulfatase activity